MNDLKIMNIINKLNKNDSINWSILENSKERIVLTNDYSSDIRFKIEVYEIERDTFQIILVKDVNQNWTDTVDCLFCGVDDDCYTDFTKLETGLKKAVEEVVYYFYSRY